MLVKDIGESCMHRLFNIMARYNIGMKIRNEITLCQFAIS